MRVFPFFSSCFSLRVKGLREGGEKKSLFMQKDLAKISNSSRFRPSLRTEGTRETLKSIGGVVRDDAILIGFLVSTLKVLLQCWSCLNGGEDDEVDSLHGFLWSVHRTGLVRKEEERLNCALRISGN